MGGGISPSSIGRARWSRWCIAGIPRDLVIVTDSQVAALDWLDACRSRATVVTRLRLDAVLYAPAPPRKPRTRGRPRLKGKRLSTLAEVAATAQAEWTMLLVPGWYGPTNNWWRSPRRRRSGSTVASLPFPFAGCSSVTRRESLRPRHYSAPSWTPPR